METLLFRDISKPKGRTQNGEWAYCFTANGLTDTAEGPMANNFNNYYIRLILPHSQLMFMIRTPSTYEC